MKMRQLSLAALIALAAAVPAQAAESPFYFRALGGLMDPSASGHDNSLNVGAGIGFRVFDEPTGSGALEADATTTLSKGKNGGGGDWNVDTVAVYFAYRTAGDVYFKAKGGFADQTVRGATDTSFPDGSSLSGGIGGGVRVSRKAGVELEYTALDHVKFLSLAVYSHF